MDYYKILEIPRDSTQEQIKKAFRKKSLKYHPDKGGDIKKFKEINDAYQILGDEEKRKRYDMGQMHNMGNFNEHMGNMGIPPEIFNMMFGGNSPFSRFSASMNNSGSTPNVRIFHNGVERTNRVAKPTPIHKNVEITLEQSYNGLKLPINIERWVVEGNMKRIERETLYIDIQKGIDNNEIIILREKGNIISDTNKGDVKIFVKIINNTNFKRNGLDLLFQKNITLKEALCGFTFDIDYFNDRKFTIKNDSNIIKPGYSKVIPDLGIERDGQKGNVIIEFNIDFPDKLTCEQVDQLKNILK